MTTKNHFANLIKLVREKLFIATPVGNGSKVYTLDTIWFARTTK